MFPNPTKNIGVTFRVRAIRHRCKAIFIIFLTPVTKISHEIFDGGFIIPDINYRRVCVLLKASDFDWKKYVILFLIYFILLPFFLFTLFSLFLFTSDILSMLLYLISRATVPHFSQT